MRNTEERTGAVLLRARKLREKRAKALNAALAALCCVLTVCLAGAFSVLTGGSRAGHVPGFYGSVLLYDGAGGYVLVGVIAFAAAVAITLACINYRNKNKPN